MSCITRDIALETCDWSTISAPGVAWSAFCALGSTCSEQQQQPPAERLRRSSPCVCARSTSYYYYPPGAVADDDDDSTVAERVTPADHRRHDGTHRRKLKVTNKAAATCAKGEQPPRKDTH